MWGTPGTLVAARGMPVDGRGTLARRLGESAEALGRDATRTASGRSVCTASPRAASARTASSGTCSCFSTASTRSGVSLGRDGVLLTRTAVVEEGLANWPMRLGAARRTMARSACSGAREHRGSSPARPRIWTTSYSRPARADLARGTSRDGEGAVDLPRHGGQRLRFLKLFARTGDERWLDRARRFAIHALEQVERRGHGRYSLWTGDLGVALFAADCLEPRAGIRCSRPGISRRRIGSDRCASSTAFVQDRPARGGRRRCAGRSSRSGRGGRARRRGPLSVARCSPSRRDERVCRASTTAPWRST